jgi:hypothetical protein
VHAPTEDKSDDTKDSYYEELERVLDQFSNTKVGRDDIFKPTTGNESLHENSDDNGIRVINFATVRNLMAKGTKVPW